MTDKERRRAYNREQKRRARARRADNADNADASARTPEPGNPYPRSSRSGRVASASAVLGDATLPALSSGARYAAARDAAAQSMRETETARLNAEEDIADTGYGPDSEQWEERVRERHAELLAQWRRPWPVLLDPQRVDYWQAELRRQALAGRARRGLTRQQSLMHRARAARGEIRLDVEAARYRPNVEADERELKERARREALELGVPLELRLVPTEDEDK